MAAGRHRALICRTAAGQMSRLRAQGREINNTHACPRPPPSQRQSSGSGRPCRSQLQRCRFLGMPSDEESLPFHHNSRFRWLAGSLAAKSHKKGRSAALAADK